LFLGRSQAINGVRIHTREKSGGKMTTRGLEKRFGTMAVEKGFITLDQLVKAMNIQILEDVDKGIHRLIGEILLELGFITVPQIDEVLDSLVKNPY
jgi:hypothetical protein